MNLGSGKINFTLLLNSTSILPTKLYTLGYRDDDKDPLLQGSFSLMGRQTYK